MTGVSTEVSWAWVDGVRVVWGQASGPLTASLIFRVGSSDETLTTKGTTHIVEHLALFRLGLRPHYQNGSVRATLTSFDTQGDPHEVVRFLREVCQSLSSLPLDRLPTELRILETEEGRRSGGVLPPLLAWRFGPNGPGLAAYEEFARRSMDGPAVQRWADLAFTRENAVLMLSGPPPDGLALPLPEGPRRSTRPLADVLPDLPAWFASPVPDVAVHSLLRRTTGAAAYAAALQRSLVETLRFQLGLSYSPQVVYDPYDATTAQLFVVADAHPEQLQQVADVLASTMSRLASAGPSQEQVDEYRDGRRRYEQSPDAGAAEAHRQAVEFLFSGAVTPPERLSAEAEALTVQDVRVAAQEAWNRALFALPEGVRLQTTQIAAAPVDSVEPSVVGRAHAHAGGAPATLVLADEGVTLRQGADAMTVRFATCRAVLAWPDGSRRLFANDGIAVTIEPEAWESGFEVVEAIDRATPHLRVVTPPRETTSRQPSDSDGAAPSARSTRSSRPPRRRLPLRTRLLLAIMAVLLIVVFGGAFYASAVGDGGAPPLTLPILLGSGALLWLALRR